MGFTDAANSTLVESNLEYYNKRALENYNNDYKKWKTNTRPRGRNSFTISRIYKLDTSLSTSTYHTYRCLEKKSLSKPFRGQAIVENYWGEPQWRESCFSFSTDKSQLIIWNTSNPSYRSYYKLVQPDTPNIDFLYE